MKLLITGGAGFMGSHLVRFMVNNYHGDSIINYDKLTYAADLANLRDIENKKNYKFVKGDICDLDFLVQILKDVDYVIHLAAESHVDNSIGNSLLFTMNNAYGTHVLLEASRLNKIKKFVHVSTDEVYGSIKKGSFSEESILSPTNPYSASKAGAEMVVKSYYNTYKIPVVIMRCNNVFGPNQYPEKIIPKAITKMLIDKKIPLHGDGSYVRTYIYIKDFLNALDTIFNKGVIGETYNTGTSDEISNLGLVKSIITILKKDESCIEFVKDRPFNDERYSVETDKLKKLGWKQQFPFEQSLNETVAWYKENMDWWIKKV